MSNEQSDNMAWFDIVIARREAFIIDCDAGFTEFLDGIFWEDNFQIDPPSLNPGTYRWQNFKVRFWGEDELMNVTDGEFVRYVLPVAA